MNDLNFILRVLKAFEFDNNDNLMWNFDKTGNVRFSANVSDQFYYACADAEDITPETVDILEQSLVDLKAIDEDIYLADLYAARVRGIRPAKHAAGWRPKDITPELESLVKDLPYPKDAWYDNGS